MFLKLGKPLLAAIYISSESTSNKRFRMPSTCSVISCFFQLASRTSAILRSVDLLDLIYVLPLYWNWTYQNCDPPRFNTLIAIPKLMLFVYHPAKPQAG